MFPFWIPTACPKPPDLYSTLLPSHSPIFAAPSQAIVQEEAAGVGQAWALEA